MFYSLLWIGKFLLGYFSREISLDEVYNVISLFFFWNFRKSITFREWVKYVAKIFLHEIWIDCGSNFQRTTLFSQELGVYQQSKYFYSAKHLLKIGIYFLFYKKPQFWVQLVGYLTQIFDSFSTLFSEYIFKLLFRERAFFLVK